MLPPLGSGYSFSVSAASSLCSIFGSVSAVPAINDVASMKQADVAAFPPPDFHSHLFHFVQIIVVVNVNKHFFLFLQRFFYSKKTLNSQCEKLKMKVI